MSAERAEILMMRVVDGFATDAERRELDELLESRPELREELEDFEAIKGVTDGLSERIRLDAMLEPPRPSPATQTWQRGSWALILVAVLGLVAFAAWSMMRDATLPLTVKVLVTMGAAGAGALFVQALRGRGRGRDPYEEIDQ